jgi:hyperpolarization activated cyclic nucleotide-gated potassium channel 2
MRSLLITLRLALQAGYGYETSNSILTMFMSTLIMIGGWIYSAYVMIIIFNIIVASSNSKDKFQELMKEVDIFCDVKELSSSLRDRIKTSLRRRFDGNYFNEEAIKQSTPECLRNEIMMHKCSNLVSRVPLFREIPSLLLRKIISCLQFQINFPGDVIIQANTVGDAMYFIAFGTAAVISASGEYFSLNFKNKKNIT